MKPLTWIISEAKKLKKQYPKRYSKWTDYVKQASAIYSSKHAGKSPVGKKKVSAVSGYWGMFSKEGDKKVAELVKYAIKHKLTIPELRKKISILEKKYPEILDTEPREAIYEAVYEKGGVKEYISGMKKTTKKKPVKKTLRNYGSHKDTKSHNVKISVISGITKGQFNMLNTWQNIYGKLAKDYITTTNIKEKQRIKKEMYTVKLILSDIKKIKSI
jgi:hypothetical protein